MWADLAFTMQQNNLVSIDSAQVITKEQLQAFDDESSCIAAGGDWEDCVVEEAVATDSGGDTGGDDGGEVVMSECEEFTSSNWELTSSYMNYDGYGNSSNCPTGPSEILNNGKFGGLFPIKDYKKLSKMIFDFYKNRTNYKKKILNGYKSLERFESKKNLDKYLFEVNNLMIG